MVPRNSTPGGFAYIWQSKWVGIIAIKTERRQIHFFSDVLIAVASLDLKVPIKGNNNSPHGNFHLFIFPFSSKFPDLNFAPYVLYIYHVMKPVRDPNSEPGLPVPRWSFWTRSWDVISHGNQGWRKCWLFSQAVWGWKERSRLTLRIKYIVVAMIAKYSPP